MWPGRSMVTPGSEQKRVGPDSDTEKFLGL